ncbi:MAG: hypothetical protein K0S47_2369 [Herbinix sp.]|jgi:uncharacterized protein YjdB|nr:hypothetical protein [Herbinix sp.]
MKKVFYHKYIITLGLLLFFTLLMPFISPLNGKTAFAQSIDPVKNDIKLNLKSVSLVKGKTFTLKVYNLKDSDKVSFKSNDTEVASVSDDGTITANKVGETTITVTVKEGETLSCDITVGPPAISIKMTKSRIVLGEGKSDILKVILKPSNTAEVARFSSYDPNIVSVSSGGRITANKFGLTYLFAQVGDSSDGTRKYAMCTVIVTAPGDVENLENYYSVTTELNSIPEQDLNQAEYDFFNVKYSSSDTKTLVEQYDQYLKSKFDFKSLTPASTDSGTVS